MPTNVRQWPPAPDSVEKSLDKIAAAIDDGDTEVTVVNMLESIAQSLYRIANVMDPDGKER